MLYSRLVSGILLRQLLWEPILIIKLFQRLYNNRPRGTETYKKKTQKKQEEGKDIVIFKPYLNSSSQEK